MPTNFSMDILKLCEPGCAGSRLWSMQAQDERGKTPPLPGVRNSSGGLLLQAWCSRGCTAMLTAKPLRP